MKKAFCLSALLSCVAPFTAAQQSYDALGQSCATDLQYDCQIIAIGFATNAVATLSETQADQEIAMIALAIVDALDGNAGPEILERAASVIISLAQFTVASDQSEALLIIANLVATGQSIPLVPQTLLASAN